MTMNDRYRAWYRPANFINNSSQYTYKRNTSFWKISIGFERDGNQISYTTWLYPVSVTYPIAMPHNNLGADFTVA